jgi:murein DD-endopeptidase MepM/ murein hydrolase activator NlpD
VAVIGSTADSRVLHFEIRVKGKPINPLNYLLKK